MVNINKNNLEVLVMDEVVVNLVNINMNIVIVFVYLSVKCVCVLG